MLNENSTAKNNLSNFEKLFFIADIKQNKDKLIHHDVLKNTDQPKLFALSLLKS